MEGSCPTRSHNSRPPSTSFRSRSKLGIRTVILRDEVFFRAKVMFLEACFKWGILTVILGDEVFFRAKDIANILGLKNIRSNTLKFTQDEKRILNYASNGGKQKQGFLTFKGLRRLLCKSRKENVPEIAKDFGIEVTRNHYLSVESETISVLKKSFYGEDMITQFSCGKFRIDLYFPLYKIAVECDEESGHTGSRISDDEERQLFITDKLGCKFVRYRPESDSFDIADVVNECFRIMIGSR